jgi:hypothetical protein
MTRDEKLLALADYIEREQSRGVDIRLSDVEAEQVVAALRGGNAQAAASRGEEYHATLCDDGSWMVNTLGDVIAIPGQGDEEQKARLICAALNAAQGPVADPLAGLDERLDRLLLTASDNNKFVLSTESAKNIVGIAREWLRSKGASALPSTERRS